MNDKTAQLNELIEITRDGQYFYEHAHDQVADAQLQALFRDMSQAMRQLIQTLAMKVAAHQEAPATGGTLAGNGSSPINIDSPLSVELYRVKMLAPRKSSGSRR